MRRKAWALSTGVALRGLVGRGRPNVFVSHAPPLGLGDRGDPAHQGFEPFLRLIDRHEPELWLHGHVHLYGPRERENREARRGETRVVNVYGHRVLEVAGRQEGF